MPKSITKDIKVSVETDYQEVSSQPENQHYVFAYRIHIMNSSDQTVQLLARKWEIIDGYGEKRIVEGEGVIGRKPILEPGQRHEYVSGCHFESPIGKMTGYYLMERLVDGTKFKVEIPSFSMIAPFKLN